MVCVAVIIPVYRAEGTLDELVQRLHASLGQITGEYEIVLVEDCGGDDSWAKICAAAEQDARVKGIWLSRNFGQHHAITAGLDVCDAEWVVVMDCDLQDQPEEIPRLYAKAQEGYQVVRARRGRRTDGWAKRISSRLFYAVFNYMTGMRYDAEVGNFRLVSRRVVKALRTMREQTRGFSIMVDWLGFPTASVDVTHGQRGEGKSTYTWSKLLRLAWNIIVAYSDKPLRLAVKGGFIMSGAAFVWGVVLFVRAMIIGCEVTGWASMIVSLYFLSGIIIALLGVLGLYLGKTFEETKRRPLYAVQAMINVPEEQA